ncbi:MAG: TRAP transporter large permease [Pseudomonadota bacterium]
MDPAVITLLVIAILAVLFLSGMPIFGALGAASVAGILMLQGVGGLGAVTGVIYDRMSGFTLVAVPLFILMGEIIFVSGIGADIYTATSRWLSGLRGSLGMASVAACAVFGALCGVSVAGAATIGKFAIPEMLKRGYDRRLATGCVAAAGGLALLIPPSVGLILYGLVANESVGLLFIAGVVPGIVLALMMMAYIFAVGLVRPEAVAATTERATRAERWASLLRIWPVAVLIAAVLGTIYTGVATPTEAAAIGCLGAALIAWLRGALGWQVIRQVLSETIQNTGMILAILSSALVFGYLLTRLRVPQDIVIFVTTSGLSEATVLVGVFLLLIVMGMFMDVVSVILIATPLLLPVIKAMGYDPIWFGIVMAIATEMAVITPPVGLNLFVIKGISPEEVSLGDVTRGALPFFGVLLAGLALFVAFPGLVLWLPFLSF